MDGEHEAPASTLSVTADEAAANLQALNGTPARGIPPMRQLAKKIRALTNDEDVARALSYLMHTAASEALVQLKAQLARTEDSIEDRAVRDALECSSLIDFRRKSS